ncbi:MAG: ROK family transcriptional regulator [Eubacteriales bacterium]
MNHRGMTTMEVKKINKGKVYHFIYQERTTSKQHIAKGLQMGLSTVTQNLKLLEEDGLIQKNGFYDSTGGRKADAIEIIANARLSIGIALLQDFIEIVATDLYGTLMVGKTYPLQYEDEDYYYERFAYHLHHFLKENKWTSTQILGVSIATQGIIAKEGTHVDYGVLIGNHKMHLDKFTTHFSYPCRLEHDSKATANLELWHHQTIQDAIVIILNRNLGGAIITNGTVQNGLHMRSGSIEHLCINQNGPQCYCGRKGCLEMYCSANSLQHLSQKSITGFFHHLRSGDPETCLLWQNYLQTLAFAIRNLSTIINGKFIISGFLAPYFTVEDILFLLTAINEQVTFPLDSTDIILSTNGEYAQARGTSLSYIQSFLANI